MREKVTLAISLAITLLLFFPLQLDYLQRTILLLVILPGAASFLLRRSFADIGLQLGNSKSVARRSFLLFLLSLPILFITAQLPLFSQYYPLYSWARLSFPHFLAYEGLIFLFMFATEFFFRGFLLLGIRKWPYANLLHAILYALAHIGKPWPEIPSSFIAGLFFGRLDLKANSILPSLILHWLFNLVLDLFILQASGFKFF